MKQQVIFISGGNPKENYKDYYDYIQKLKVDPYADFFSNYNKKLGKYLGADYDYIRLTMPEKKFADYKAWEITFEKLLPFLRDNCIIVTTSLGSTFVLKYLQKYLLRVKIEKIFFLAAAIEDSDNEILGSFGFENHDFSNLKKQCSDIYLYHSKDDKSVPFSQLKIMEQAFPNAKIRIFEDRGHFYNNERFIELEEDIKS